MKKVPDQNPIGLLLILVTVLILLVVFMASGCYNSKKAANQTSKALNEYPEVAARLIRQSFPCDTTSIDSTGFKTSIEEANGYIRILDSIVEANVYKNDRLEEVADSLKRLLLLDTLDICDSIFEPLYRECSSIKRENNDLKKAGKKAESVIYFLKKQINEFKPVVQTVKDNAEVFLAQKKMYEWKLAYQKEEKKKDQWKKIALISLAINLILSFFIYKTKRK